jgi:hypothetical protein
VTIRQLLNAESLPAGGELVVDNAELSQVEILGRINKINISSSNTQYVIDDGTGSIDVRKFTDLQEDDDNEIQGESPRFRFPYKGKVLSLELSELLKYSTQKRASLPIKYLQLSPLMKLHTII